MRTHARGRLRLAPRPPPALAELTRVPARAACVGPAPLSENWLPTFDKKAGGYAGKIATQTQKKIDLQAAGAGAAAAGAKAKAE